MTKDQDEFHEVLLKASLMDMFHFNGRKHTCENCEDYRAKICKGHLYNSIELCMIEKAKSNEMIFSSFDEEN